MTVSEQAVLRNALATAHEKIAELEAAISGQNTASLALKTENTKMKTENAELRNTAAAQGVAIAKTTFYLKKYDNHNMSTLMTSGFNDRRNKFRAKRGFRGSDGAKPAGGDVGDQAKKDQGPRRSRPPQNDHSKIILRYGIDMCPCCGGRIVKKYAIYRMVGDLDGNKKRTDATAVWGGGSWCERSGAEARAPMPFLDGTSLDPVTLGIITDLYSYGITDANISDFLESAFRFRISESAVANARRAVSGAQGRIRRAGRTACPHQACLLEVGVRAHGRDRIQDRRNRQDRLRVGGHRPGRGLGGVRADQSGGRPARTLWVATGQTGGGRRPPGLQVAFSADTAMLEAYWP